MTGVTQARLTPTNGVWHELPDVQRRERAKDDTVLFGASYTTVDEPVRWKTHKHTHTHAWTRARARARTHTHTKLTHFLAHTLAQSKLLLLLLLPLWCALLKPSINLTCLVLTPPLKYLHLSFSRSSGYFLKPHVLCLTKALVLCKILQMHAGLSD